MASDTSNEARVGPFKNKGFFSGFLLKLPPLETYDYLTQNTNGCVDDETEQALLARREPLVDLAIALTSQNAEVVSDLYDEGDAALRIAALSNQSIRSFGIGRAWVSDKQFEALLSSGAWEELEAFFANDVTREDLERVLNPDN